MADLARLNMRTSHQNIEESDGQEANRGLTMRERAKKARHEAYVIAKERRKNDPRTIALKEKLKKNRQEANKLAKERAKTRAGATKKAKRAGKDARLKSNLAFANTSYVNFRS
jgi:hypothetical protein